MYSALIHIMGISAFKNAVLLLLVVVLDLGLVGSVFNLPIPGLIVVLDL